MASTNTILNIILLFIFNISSNLLLTPMLKDIKLPYVILLLNTVLNIIISFIIFSVSSKQSISANIKKYFLLGVLSSIFNFLSIYVNYKLEYFSISFLSNLFLILHFLICINCTRIKYLIIFITAFIISSIPDINNIINQKYEAINILWISLYSLYIVVYSLYFHYIYYQSTNNEISNLLLISNSSQLLMLVLFFWLDLIPNFGYSLTLADFISNFSKSQTFFEIIYIGIFFGWSTTTYLKQYCGITVLQYITSTDLYYILISGHIVSSIMYETSYYNMVYKIIGYIIYTSIVIYMITKKENIPINNNNNFEITNLIEHKIIIDEYKIIVDKSDEYKIIDELQPGSNNELEYI